VLEISAWIAINNAHVFMNLVVARLYIAVRSRYRTSVVPKLAENGIFRGYFPIGSVALVVMTTGMAATTSVAAEMPT
jgi:hypothetical protein